MQGIYRIRNKLDGMRYVGSSNDFERRWEKEHYPELCEGVHYNPYLQNAWNKYGEKNFVFEIEEEIEGDRETLLDREQVYLDEGFALGNLYNIVRKADCPANDERSEKHCKNISKGLMGHITTEETKAKQSKSHTGKVLSEEHCANISKANMGREVTEETRTKIGDANRGRVLGPIPEESRRKNSEWHLEYYKTHDQWNKGKSSHMKGKHHTPEALDKMAKPYPAFYNDLTSELIPNGHNLARLCSVRGFKYATIYAIKAGVNKQTKDGWRLATEAEIASGAMF